MHGDAHHFFQEYKEYSEGREEKGERCFSSLRKVKQWLLFAIRDETSGKLSCRAGLWYYKWHKQLKIVLRVLVNSSGLLNFLSVIVFQENF